MDRKGRAYYPRKARAIMAMALVEKLYKASATAKSVNPQISDLGLFSSD